MFDFNTCYTANRTTMALEQRVCDGGASEASTNHIKAGKASAKLGGGKSGPYLKIMVTEAFAGTGTTLAIYMETDTDSGFASALKQVIHLGTIAKASLVAGTVFSIKLPFAIWQRYRRLYFTGDNTFEATGKIVAWEDEAPDPAQSQIDMIA